jgi:primosomal replication protein N''
VTDLVRYCPSCKSERPLAEAECLNEVDGNVCGWFLSDGPIQQRGAAPPIRPPSLPTRPLSNQCPNGHLVEPGDTLCLQCGAELTQVTQPPSPEGEPISAAPTEIDGWTLDELLTIGAGPWSHYIARRQDLGRALLTLYQPGAEPDPAVHGVLRKMDRDHVPELLATGRWNDQAYEVTELIAGSSLRESGHFAAADPGLLRRVVDELGRALAGFADLGLRHRDLRPETILLRSKEPLDLVITGFGSARLSDFDLDSVAPLKLTRYSSPEAIVGGVSAASDWWSLGMILLEHITGGACFVGVNDAAFHIHIVTRGVEIPGNLDPNFRLLLRGLLSRDPSKRWHWDQVRAWLAGEAVELPAEAASGRDDGTGPALELADRRFFRPETFALAAAEVTNWEAAKALFLRGALATWLEGRRIDGTIVSSIRRLASDEELSEDYRHALALMSLNPSLPLTVRGEIVTPAWLLAHPQEGYAIVTGAVSRNLQRMDREPWLVRLRGRAEAVRQRAKVLEIELDEERLRIALLASSRSNLEAERSALRKVYPDSDHAGLSSLVDHDRLSDEELIVLVSAAHHQFVPFATLLDSTEKLAKQHSVDGIDHSSATALFTRSRREIYAEVEARTAGFASSPYPRINEWADTFRVEHRIPLPRAAVLLAVPRVLWAEPPRQQYVATLLDHFEKRVARSVQRGPLVRFVISKTSARVDLTELGTALRPAEAALDQLLRRGEAPVSLDSSVFNAREGLLPRLRRLVSHALTFRRDTGIDGRYLGFPFLIIKDDRLTSSGAKPRIAPVLLWPVIIELPPGASARPSLGFDRERDDVRLNPALEGLFEPSELERWREAREELLRRPLIRTSDVMDVFGPLAAPLGRTLAQLPPKDSRLRESKRGLSCAAALFNAEFTGQAIAEDLRKLRIKSPSGTALEPALRVSTGPIETPAAIPPQSHDHYLTVESDPSQEAAVAKARTAPGLLVEGPPGTGKSQTIVNIIADCIGRKETVLVVCQKQPALRVVQKRLEAEGLGDRIFSIIDVNADREPIIRSLRDQVDRIRSSPRAGLITERHQRRGIAARIGTLEAEINRHHESIHAVDELNGLSYRGVLAELILLENNESPPSVPGLRNRLSSIGQERLVELEETCGTLAHLWFTSDFETSALKVLRHFPTDDAVAGELAQDLAAFLEAESKRAEVQRTSIASFELDDPAPLRQWFDKHESLILTMVPDVRAAVQRWISQFLASARSLPAGPQIIATLRASMASLAELDRPEVNTNLLGKAAAQPVDAVKYWLAMSTIAVTDVSFLGHLSPSRWQKRRRYKKWLTQLSLDPNEPNMIAMCTALGLELQLRPVRQVVQDACKNLGLSNGGLLTAVDIGSETRGLLASLENVQKAVEAALACPRPNEAVAMLTAGSLEAYLAFRQELDAALARQAARTESVRALDNLVQWFAEDWIAAMRACIARYRPAVGLTHLQAALPTLGPFQRFRARARQLDPEVIAMFAALRPHVKALGSLSAEQLEATVRRIIKREALLAWKARTEQAHPSLLLQRQEIQRKVTSLEVAEKELRAINRTLLARDIDQGLLGSASAWEGITRLRGPRSRRLREIIELGTDIGLMSLRPVWLMNPDTVSRVLPLRGGQFDVVVFDEASQMLVEHATPALFRAKRVVISGDEKQMPPTSFFSSRGGSDEEDEFDGAELDESASDSERDIFEETWNRREIKDCPDLLALGHGCLPVTTLQIHYRSKYRELIEYSNAAFYASRLSVPARHPDALIQNVRPIEVVRVDGIYEAQTNPAEARRVVEVLRGLWSRSADHRPSIGIVTFNRKQADLIDDMIAERAGIDQDFLAAYQRESRRVQDGEDMSLFVRNVENVQGDERDVIIFSTTFGRDRAGSFKRFFGVLGQVGGERRLNVAVTRAREKVVLVTSMPIKDVSDMLATGRGPTKPRDYLQAYLDYATKVSSGQLDLARSCASRLATGVTTQAANGASNDCFVAVVADYMRGLGLSPIAKNDGDAFGVDLAVEDPKTGLFGLAVECDSPSDRHGHLSSARAREIWRPAVMRRGIRVIHRVSSAGWYHDGEDERQRLRAAIYHALG